MTINMYQEFLPSGKPITYLEKDGKLWMRVKATEQEVINMIKELAEEKNLKWVELNNFDLAEQEFIKEQNDRLSNS